MQTTMKTMDTVMTPDTGLDEESRQGIAKTLNTILADEHMLYVKMRNYHWNVTGIHFQSLHALFEEQYNAIKPAADEIAERVRMYGYAAIGTLSEFQEWSRLSETPGEIPPAETMISNLVKDHEALIRYLRTDIERCQDDFADEGTADLLTGLLQKHLQMAWMLRAHLA